MRKQFQIKKVCTLPNRPAYSYKLDEYFDDFVYENILKPFDVIIDTSRSVVLSIMIFTREESGIDGIGLYEPTTVEDAGVTYYPVSINIEDIYKDDNTIGNIVSLYFQVISLFFLNNYKSIYNEYMLQLKEKLDWDYLLNLPHPATYNEQKYVGDKAL